MNVNQRNLRSRPTGNGLTSLSSSTTLKTTVYDENVAPTSLMGAKQANNSSSNLAGLKKATSTTTFGATKRTTLGDVTNLHSGVAASQAAKKTANVVITAKPTNPAPGTNALNVNGNAVAKVTSNVTAARPARVPLKSQGTTTVSVPASNAAVLKPKFQTDSYANLTNFSTFDPKYAELIQSKEQMLYHEQPEEEISSDDEEEIDDSDELLSEIGNDQDDMGSEFKAIEPMEIDKAQTLYQSQKQGSVYQFEEAEEFEEVEDIDMFDHDDPQFCTEYVHHIFEFWRRREVDDAINPRYMEKQLDIAEKHRAILVDWMAEVSVKFRLSTETIFLAINVLDRYLQVRTIPRPKLQLVGVAALLIASKFEEIYTPEVRDFVWITAKAYTREELLTMERNILVAINFNLATPTPLHFLRRFSKAARSDSKIHTVSKYVTELSLLEYKMLSYLPSVIAAAAVYISRKMCGVAPLWNPTLEYHTGYRVSDIMDCVRDLNAIVKKQATTKFRAINRKYSNPKLLSVANLPVCQDL